MSARRRASAAAPAAEDRDRLGIAAVALLAVALAGATLVVDVRAAAAFDAPKRLIAILGIVAAAGCLLARRDLRLAVPAGTRRLVLGAFVVALNGAVLATLASPRPAIALDGLRTLALFALALPLGASRALAGGRAAWMLAAFVAAVAVNAVASLLQAAGLELFAVAAITGRADTGAFLGNEGHLAQLAALALVATVAVTAVARSSRLRAAAVVTSVVFVAALLVNRNLTALVTAAAGAALALVLGRGRRAVAALALLAVALAAGITVHAPLRARVGEAVQAARAGEWDALTTYRLGPWAAALEMIRERPLLGFGPGTYGAEFMDHRLKAEMRHRQRLVIPLLTSSFGEAHSEYLQAAAEGGIPAALAVVAALVALLAALVPIAADPNDARRGEALVIVALLGAAAIAVLTWFPLQRPSSALALLLAAGRGWSLVHPTKPGGDARRGGRLAVAAVVLLLVAAVVPELLRYAAERRLAAVTAAVGEVVAGGRVVPELAPMLERLAAAARATADASPSDVRGLIAAGTALTVAGRGEAARVDYRAALARGERAEIDLNLARAYAVDRRLDDADAAVLRMAWISPTMIGSLPRFDRPRYEAALADLVERLHAGTLAAPPPLPSE